MSDLEELTAEAWHAYQRIRTDRRQWRQAVQLIRAVSFARDLQAGAIPSREDRQRVRDLFADTEPEGSARALWSRTKAPEALELFDYMRGSGYL